MVQAGFEPVILGLDTSRIRGEKDTRLNHSATGSADHILSTYSGFFSTLFWQVLTTTCRKIELEHFQAELEQFFA